MTQTLRTGLVVSADASELIGEMRQGKEALASLRREANVLGTDLTRTGASADRFVSVFARANGTFRAFGAETKSAKDSATALGAALDQEERQFRELALALDPAARALAEFEAGQAQVNRALRLGIATEEEAIRTLGMLESRLDTVMGAMGRGTAVAGSFGTQLQQASYQITDGLVQLQGGVSPMIVLAQQGSQLAGSFGVWGAAIGVVLALSAPLVSFLFDAGDAARNLDTVMGDLEASSDRVAEGLKRLRDPNLSQVFGSLTGDARQLTGVLVELDRAAQLRDLRKSLDGLLKASVDPGLGQSMWAGFQEGLVGRPMYLPSQVDAMQYATMQDNYAQLTGGRGPSLEEFNDRRAQIDAFAKAGNAKGVVSEINSLIDALKAGRNFADLTPELQKTLASLADVAQQAAEVEAQFNHTADATKIWAGIVESATSFWDGILERAARLREDGEERLRVAENERALAETIWRFGEDSAEADAERARIARENYQIELEKAGLYEDHVSDLMAAYDATVAAQGATAIWADNMAAVGAEVSSIMSMIAAMGGGMIDRASKFAELKALESGASVAEGAAARKSAKQEAEWSAREMGGWADKAVVAVERWWAKGDAEIDAKIEAARDGARSRDRTAALGSGAGGGGGKGGRDVTDEITRLKPSYEADIAAAEEWRDKALASLDKTTAGYEQFAADVNAIFEDRVAAAYRADLERRDDWQAGAGRAILSLKDDMMSWADLSENIFTKFGEAGEQAFVSLMTGSKASIGDLADFVIEQFARMAYQQAILPGLESIFGAIFPALVPGGASGGGASLNTNHTGSPGVMRTYALGNLGGYGDTPRSDERLTMMRRGEEILTARALENAGALISAMTSLAARPSQAAGGGGMNVQIVNKSSRAQVEVEEEGGTDSRGQRQARFVVSDAIATGLVTPGGRGAKAMKQVYGVTPAARRRS